MPREVTVLPNLRILLPFVSQEVKEVQHPWTSPRLHFPSPATLGPSSLPTSVLPLLAFPGPTGTTFCPASCFFHRAPCPHLFPWVPVREGHCCATTMSLDPTRTRSTWAWRSRPMPQHGGGQAGGPESLVYQLAVQLLAPTDCPYGGFTNKALASRPLGEH